MNQRIREFMEQAVIAVDNPFPGNPLNDELEKMYIPDCFAEKFAELIVKECAETVQDFVDHRFPASEYPERLKKYFGIKE